MTRLFTCLLLSLLLLPLLTQPAAAQSPAPDDGRGAWSEVAGLAGAAPASAMGDPLPTNFQLLALNRAALAEALAAAPAQTQAQAVLAADAAPLLLALPLPDGSFARFAIVRSPVLAPQLAARHPEIQTYRGAGVDDPNASVRLGLTPGGFHAVILNGVQSVYITPYNAGSDPLYMSYDAADLPAPEPFVCGVQEGMRPGEPASLAAELGELVPALSAGETLRTYRLALAATGEFAADAAERAGLVAPAEIQLRAAALDALVARVNLVNAIYEREVAIHFNLVEDNEQLIFVNAAADPYTDNRMDLMLAENQAVVDDVIGGAGYDIGHVLGAAGGGIAYLGVACNERYKAGGVSGSAAAVSAYAAMVTAHEMGHQFDAGHSFNANSGSCGGGNRMRRSAYEVGSGSTIMSYAGLCAAGQNLPSYNIMFHVVSFDEILSYSRSGDGAACGDAAATGNRPPVVDAGSDRTIPARTPFVLSGAATDPDGDAVLYSWQQVDIGVLPISGTATLTEAVTDWGSGPLYRIYPFASTGAARSFPSLQHVLDGSTALGEVYPTTTRTLNFRLFARDARSGGGGANYDAVRLNVVDSGAAFAVLNPNSATAWPGGLQRTVAWNVAGTDGPPVSCAAVDVRLSADGGASFATFLAERTPNDGAELVTLPAQAIAGARIQVRCSDSIFYSISPPFTLAAAGPFGVLSGEVHDQSGAPVEGGTLVVSGAEVVTTTSGSSGQYSVQLLPGTYALQVSAYGYRDSSSSGIVISDGVTTTRDAVLARLPQQVVTGAVRDAGHGYGLYATLTFTDAVRGRQAGRTWSDPVSGVYSATLYTGIAYDMSVESWLPGYTVALAGVEAGEVLLAPMADCAAPGYALAGGVCTPLAGGLLVGATYGPAGSAGPVAGVPLPGVRVAGGGRTAISAVTPDPAVVDAFYTLFLPPGSQPVTATGVYSGAALPSLGGTAPVGAGATMQWNFDWQPIFVDAHLRDLSLSSGQLTPPFTADVLSYTTAVEGGVSTFTVLPVTLIPGARITVNGMAAVSGIPSPSIGLAVGENTIAVAVTALDGVTTRNYQIIVTRAAPVNLPLYLPYARR